MRDMLALERHENGKLVFGLQRERDLTLAVQLSHKRALAHDSFVAFGHVALRHLEFCFGHPNQI